MEGLERHLRPGLSYTLGPHGPHCAAWLYPLLMVPAEPTLVSKRKNVVENFEHEGLGQSILCLCLMHVCDGATSTGCCLLGLPLFLLRPLFARLFDNQPRFRNT